MGLLPAELVLPSFFGVELLGGMLDDGITLVPRSPDVMLYLDGHHVSYPLSLGVPVQLTGGGQPLRVIGYAPGTEAIAETALKPRKVPEGLIKSREETRLS